MRFVANDHAVYLIFDTVPDKVQHSEDELGDLARAVSAAGHDQMFDPIMRAYGEAKCRRLALEESKPVMRKMGGGSP